jgi:acyl transferase domain-containing protein/acyl carrier protein/NADP-dependent 3-hydroxy acid dehydrogenase YdfG
MNNTGLEIAIIGISCKVPGAKDWREFWKNLIEGKESISFFTDEELENLNVSKETLEHPNFIRFKSNLPEKNNFDSVFFDYTPTEAKYLNPSHRHLHECAWSAIEDAGYKLKDYKGSIGVFAGTNEDFNWRAYSKIENRKGEIDEYSLNLLSNSNFLTTALSYKFDLTGPSYAINTACSTSLVAVHQACNSLLLGECKMALAGGINILTEKQKGLFHKPGMIISSDGHCRPFDEEADGAVPGEGMGIVVLKKLKDAIADGDNIYAVIKGSAINNDGHRKVGFTAPSVDGQSNCIKNAMKFANVNPESISYIECHGTGTKLGDPVEIQSLNTAFHFKLEKFCAIGSVKGNIGHLDVAAGIIGLIKTALVLKFRLIPPSLNYLKPNPSIPFENGPFYVNSILKKVNMKDSEIFRASVSSFGVGGTNAHAVLEEFPIKDIIEDNGNYKLLCLSAKSATSLIAYQENLAKFLKEEDNLDLLDMCYTMAMGRTAFSKRKSIIFRDRAELLKSLNGSKAENIFPISINTTKIVFMFPGQGSQFEGLGNELYEKETIFREYVDLGFQLAAKFTDLPLKSTFFKKEQSSYSTVFLQPLLFIYEYSLAKSILKLGIKPDYLIGHSLGEYVAAAISGILSYEIALKIIIRRAELSEKIRDGKMLAVNLNEANLSEYLNKDISLASINSEEQTVLAGNEAEIDFLKQKLNNDNIPNIELGISKPFHSHLIDPILNEFYDEIKETGFGKMEIPIVSSVTGTLISEEKISSVNYWVNQLRNPVRFSNGCNFIAQRAKNLISIEVGPGAILSSFIRKNIKKNSDLNIVNFLNHELGNINEHKGYLKGIGKLWELGLDIQWKNYYPSSKRISLPTYVFEKIQYPVEVDPIENSRLEINNIEQNVNGSLVSIPHWMVSCRMKFKDINFNKTILIFSDESDFAKRFDREINLGNHTIIRIYQRDYYSYNDNLNEFCISPNNQTHFEDLLKDLEQRNFFITDMIYLWDLKFRNSNCINEISYNSFFNLSNLIKQFKSNYIDNQLNLVVVTNSFFNVIGNETINIEQSFKIGITNSGSQEYKGTIRIFDININTIVDEDYSNVINEFLDDSDFQRVVAFRNGRRWIQAYQAISADEQKYVNPIIKKDGIYLITGGLGKLGYELAKQISQRYNSTIVLVGRTTLDSSVENNTIVRRFNELLEINEDIHYYSVDISNITNFKDIVDKIQSDIGIINGVIHAAGVTDIRNFELIDETNLENALTIFKPKVEGILNLYQIFCNSKLDFLCATSSISTVVGGIGFSAYSAANLFLESFISSVHKEGLNWKCISLPGILYNNQSENIVTLKDRKGWYVKEIFELINWSIDKNEPSVILALIKNIEDWIKESYPMHGLESEIFSPEIKVGSKDRSNISSPYIEAGNPTERKLKKLINEFLGVDNIGIQDNFFELGLDSLKSMMLVRKLKDHFEFPPDLKSFLLHPTIKEQAEIIDDRTQVKLIQQETKNTIII